jgi:RNA polymerase sigma-70 factor (ECF subfamily)
MDAVDRQDSAPDADEAYRPYLMTLGAAGLSPGPRDRVDLSGVVQQTLLEAHRDAAAFAGEPGQRAAWVRQIFARNLSDALRATGAAKRDAARERSLEGDLDRSAARLADLIPAPGPSPSGRLRREERAVALAAALAGLPDAQREALVLQHWHGRSLKEIAARMGKTPVAVAGLLKRGLRQLRERLGEDVP